MNGEKEGAAAGGVGFEDGGDVAHLAEIEAVEGFVDHEQGLRGEEAEGEEAALALAL